MSRARPAGERVKQRPEYDYHRYDRAVGDAIKSGMSGELRFPDHYKS